MSHVYDRYGARDHGTVPPESGRHRACGRSRRVLAVRPGARDGGRRGTKDESVADRHRQRAASGATAEILRALGKELAAVWDRHAQLAGWRAALSGSEGIVARRRFES